MLTVEQYPILRQNTSFCQNRTNDNKDKFNIYRVMCDPLI